MNQLDSLLRSLAPNHSLDENMTVAIKKLKETGEHHSVYQLSSEINPYMIVDLSSKAEELQLYGLYEMWSTETLNKKTMEEL